MHRQFQYSLLGVCATIRDPVKGEFKEQTKNHFVSCGFPWTQAPLRATHCRRRREPPLSRFPEAQCKFKPLKGGRARKPIKTSEER